MFLQILRDTGLWYSVEYSSFRVGPEADKYRLGVSGFSGDEGDALAAPPNALRVVNGMKFGALDQDNDNRSSGQWTGGKAGGNDGVVVSVGEQWSVCGWKR